MTDFTYRPIKIDAYFDKIFYINMAKDLDRNLHMIEQFKKFGIANYERVEGVEIAEVPWISQWRNFIKKDEKYIKGQLGCRAAHLECIEIARNRRYSRVLILEDDAVFTSDPHQLITQNHEILNDWDVLYFGGLIEPFFRNQIVCLHAYAVKSTVFEDIIHMSEASGMEMDNFYAKVIQHMSYNNNQSGKYNIRVILPFNQIVQNKSFNSNIQT
jgi:GR25 family glycosyltransferase involved in LPS biosynthesis